MAPKVGCAICRLLQDKEFRITETSFWDVRLASQQMRPARCMTILKRHAATEIGLFESKWLELRQLRQRLHPAILRAYQATHLNTFILMNGAWRDGDASAAIQAHVHYWDVPRYARSFTIGDVGFDDPAYPLVNADELSPSIPHIPAEIRNQIIRVIQSIL